MAMAWSVSRPLCDVMPTIGSGEVGSQSEGELAGGEGVVAAADAVVAADRVDAAEEDEAAGVVTEKGGGGDVAPRPAVRLRLRLMPLVLLRRLLTEDADVLRGARHGTSSSRLRQQSARLLMPLTPVMLTGSLRRTRCCQGGTSWGRQGPGC